MVSSALNDGGLNTINSAIRGSTLMHANNPSNVLMASNVSQMGANAVVSGASGGAFNNNNTGVSLAATTDVAATTVFVNDANEKINETRPTTLDSSLAVGKTDDNSIALFMSKPYSISSINWSSSSGRNAILGTFRVADYLTGSSTPTIWRNKLSGYNLMRGKAVLKILINAQPFQAGRLLIHMLPCEQQFSAHSSNYTKQHNFSIASKTQQPSVEVDVADGTATLKVPYVAPTLWFSRESPFDWGTFYISVLSPLASASATNVNISVYMYFEDFELAAPIFGPEMAKGKSLGSTSNIKRERESTKKGGIVSTFLDALVRPADILKEVPVIGPFASIASSALSFGSSVASFFGWSRPLDMRGTQIVKSHHQYQGFNFNGTNASDVLAMDAGNQLAPMESFAGSSVDEMAYSYLKKIPSLIDTFSWNTSSGANTNLYSLTASCVNMGYRSTVSTSVTSTRNAYTMAPFAYLSQYFRYYRGSIVITVKFVKTQFHSGRLSLTFTPSTINVPTTANGRAYVYREVIDLRESDTYSFTLPYMHPAPFLNTGWNSDLPPSDYSFGTLRVDVINPLISASTVSSSIDALVYACAGDDFQLTALHPTSTCTFVPEMNTDIPRVSGTIGDAPLSEISIIPPALCAGESFLSIKQLLQLARPLTSSRSFRNGTNFNGVTVHSYSLSPYYPGAPTPFAGGIFDELNVPACGCLDYISELTTGFAFARGSIRLVDPTIPSTDGATFSYLTTVEGSSPLYSDLTSSELQLTSGLQTGTIQLGVGRKNVVPLAHRDVKASTLDAIIPAYGQTPFRLNYPMNYISENTPTTYDSPDYYINVVTPANTSIVRAPYRSGGDDYAAGYFIGFPPILFL